MKRLAGLLALLVSSPASALASAMPPEPMPVPSPGVAIAGHANVHVTDLVVVCASDTVVETTASCEVQAHITLEAVEPLVIERLGETAPGEITLDGEPLVERSDLAQGRVVVLVERFRASLSTSTRYADEPWYITPIRVRHFYLGETSGASRSGDASFGVLVDGPSLAMVGTTHVVAELDGVELAFGGERITGDRELSPQHTGIALGLSVPPSEPPILQHGGPVLGLGARFSLDHEDDGRFLLRVAYELGLADYVVMSLSFETDFESILESAVVELGSPEAIVLFPSVAVGAGVVARQLGNRDADAALRLRVGANILFAGFTVDFDYWPTIGEWTGSVVGRVSF